MGNILGLVGHMISVAISQLCYCSVKAAVENGVKEWQQLSFSKLGEEPNFISLEYNHIVLFCHLYINIY